LHNYWNTPAVEEAVPLIGATRVSPVPGCNLVAENFRGSLQNGGGWVGGCDSH